ncbi:hypothetical protein [uncultured Paracoccus sp.]|uniref:hypothetical protein n=1 Tax=uncultured Paracoccus sp. TaxID=189685 RepID=UPI002607B981|nr:hypothetical protein [uncultured Paracoccus sp.]
MRWLVLMLVLAILPLDALAEDRPRSGLMWNRSRLPATFPVVVKTPPGEDYVMFVTRPADGAAVMAGYIRGGDFFRLLVPPGEWRLRFAFGTAWQGETNLFGAATDWIDVQHALDFRVLGLNRRRAYVITLTEQDGTVKVVDARPGAECQLVLWNSEIREAPVDLPGMSPEEREVLVGPQQEPLTRPRLRYVDSEFDVYTRLCE